MKYDLEALFVVEHMRNGEWRRHIGSEPAFLECIALDYAAKLKREFPDTQTRVVRYGRLEFQPTPSAVAGETQPKPGTFLVNKNCGTVAGLIQSLQFMIAHGLPENAVVNAWDADVEKYSQVTGYLYDRDSIELQTDTEE